MGCGSSTLKGEGGFGVDDAGPQPVNKRFASKPLQTFNEVDYDETAANQRRRHTEYAPHEQVRASPTASRAESRGDAEAPPTAAKKDSNTLLKPYISINNDPTAIGNGSSSTAPEPAAEIVDEDSRKSKFGSYLSTQSNRFSRSKSKTSYTDEELMKYTGMTNEQLKEWGDKNVKDRSPLNPGASAFLVTPISM